VREVPGSPRRIWDVFRLCRPPQALGYSRLYYGYQPPLMGHIQRVFGNKIPPEAVPSNEVL